MTNPLQQALVPLAEAAGYSVVELKPRRPKLTGWRVFDKYGMDTPLPGANGSLKGEVEVVEQWLAKARYVVTIFPDELANDGSDAWEIWVQRQSDWMNNAIAAIVGEGKSLHEALAEAVKALSK